MTQRTAIIGDVHGLTTSLEALVHKLALQAGDTLVFVGDLVDKGPDPVGTLEFAASLDTDAKFDVVFVEGNHEDRHRRFQRNITLRPKVARDQAAAEPQLTALAEFLSDSARAFLEKAVPFWRDVQSNILVVHGGIPGSMKEFPESVEAFEALTGKAKTEASKLLRTRFIDAQTGAFLALGKEQPGDPFWAQVYDGRFGHVVFGHQPFLDGPAYFPHATGIDTGAVHGGPLTALVLEKAGGQSVVQVPGIAHKPYRGHHHLAAAMGAARPR